MGATIEIKVTDNAAEVIRGLQAFPPEMQTAIAAALDLQNERTVGQIQARKLSRRGPKTLGVVTNRLRSSIRKVDATITGTNIDSGIGSNVKYAGAHEFGFTGSVQVRAHQGEHRALDVFKVKGGRLVQGFELTGAGGRGTRVAIGFVNVRAHQMKMNIPERAYIRSTIQEEAPNYSRTISAAILKAWEERA